jgi:hypothetical protein
VSAAALKLPLRLAAALPQVLGRPYLLDAAKGRCPCHRSEQIISVIREPMMAPLIALTIMPISGAPLDGRSATAGVSSRDRPIYKLSSLQREPALPKVTGAPKCAKRRTWPAITLIPALAGRNVRLVAAHSQAATPLERCKVSPGGLMAAPCLPGGAAVLSCATVQHRVGFSQQHFPTKRP